MASSFVILDPSLKGFNGHFLHYDHVLATEAKRRGFSVSTLANKDCDPHLKADLPTVPCFRFGLEHAFVHPWLVQRFEFARKQNQRKHRSHYLTDLRQARGQIQIDRSSIAFLHTTTYNQLAPVVDWLKSFDTSVRPTLVILLRYAPSPNPFYPGFYEAREYQRGLKYLENSSMKKWVRLVTDSEILQAEYAELTSLPIHLVPIPHTYERTQKVRNGQSRMMSYLGNARSTKGFQYLPYVMESIRDVLESQSWSAELQSNVMFQRDLDSVWAVKRLKRLPVKLREQELSSEEYNSLLLRSSLVLLPYQLLYYYAQTSGVLSEALSAGIPVVVSRGTWMAQQIKGRDIGTTFLPGDQVSFEAAVRDAMNRINTLERNAEAFSEEWIQKHNPKTFFDALLKAVG